MTFKLHVHIHCSVANELWNAVLVPWGMSWVFPVTVVELIQERYGARMGRRRSYGLWSVVPDVVNLEREEL